MDFRNSLNSLEKKWSLLGVILAVIFGGLTVYSEFIRNREPALRFDVVSNTSVLDVREELGKLEIFYDGLDIKKSKQSLRVILVRVVNPGETDILMSHYDERVPLGFTVSNGELLRVELLEASNQYLISNLRVTFTDSLRGVFEPVILESKEFFIFKALVLHLQGAPPTLSPMGKIAGIRTINLTEPLSNDSEKSYWNLVFAGGVWVQSARLISYFFGLVILLFAVISPVVFVSGKLTRRKRVKHVKHFRRVSEIELLDKDEFLFSVYEDFGYHYVYAMGQLLSSKTKLQETFDKLSEQNDVSDQLYMGVGTPDAPPTIMLGQERGIHALLQNNVIQRKGDTWEQDEHVVQTILEFYRFLTIIHGGD